MEKERGVNVLIGDSNVGMQVGVDMAIENDIGIIGHVDHGRFQHDIMGPNPDVIIVDEDNVGSITEALKRETEIRYHEATFQMPYNFEKKTNKYNNKDHQRSIKNKIAKRRKR